MPDDTDQEPSELRQLPWGSVLKQILARIKDPAGLVAIALYVLAAPIGLYVGSLALSFGCAFALSALFMGYNIIVVRQKTLNDARKIDHDRDIKLAKIQADLVAKLDRQSARSAPLQIKAPALIAPQRPVSPSSARKNKDAH